MTVQWSHPPMPTTFTLLAIKKARGVKAWQSLFGFSGMHTSTHTTNTVLFINQLAVTLGSQAEHH